MDGWRLPCWAGSPFRASSRSPLDASWKLTWREPAASKARELARPTSLMCSAVSIYQLSRPQKVPYAFLTHRCWSSCKRLSDTYFSSLDK